MTKEHLVCPWRAGPILTASIRRRVHDPQRIMAPYLSDGMIAMDIGCGMGFFTLPMSEMVGDNGNVIAVDMQEKMLDGLKKNAEKIDADNVTLHQCTQNSLRIEKWNGTIDFILIFWVLHEVPDPIRLIHELQAALSPSGRLLFVEPFMHVSNTKFQKSIDMITESGFIIVDTPKISMSRTALLTPKG